MSQAPLTRRTFLATLTIGGAAVAISSIAGADAPALTEDDPTAKALGYKADATKVDATKFANYKPGQNCATCKLVQGTDGPAMRPCALFPGKTVHAAGWCAAFAPK